jgi:hypothetical protein
MEDILKVYHRPYHELFPVICMDESNKQLIGEVASPIPMAPGHPELIDHEYVRNGVADIFLKLNRWPEKGIQKSLNVETAKNGRFYKGMLEERYPHAVKVVLVMDNLNTHSIASLYERFSPEHARRLADRLGIHYTPKHGSWLNIAEIELSVLSRQCLNRRIETLEEMRRETSQWKAIRNSNRTPVNWQFTCEDARIKLKRLYPSL